jgi:CRP-like cAMP-binding protein
MPRQQDAQLSKQEGKITLALSDFQSHQFKSLRRAAQAFNVPRTTLSARRRGRLFIDDRRNAQHKLTRTKEQTIVRYILNLDSRGFAPRLCEVADMADKLLGVRDGEPVGKH